MRAVEGPLVECDFDETRPDQNAHHDEKGEGVYVSGSESEPKPVAAQKQMQMQESQRIAKPIPPEIDAAHFGNDRIDIMDIGSEHLLSSPSCAVLLPSSVATPCLNANVSWPACVGERHYKDVGVHTKVSLNVRHRVVSPARIAERTASPEIRLKL